MGVYVHERCHRCRASLTGGYVPNYFTVGEPIVECDRCNALNSRAGKCSEWAIMPRFRKTKLVLLAGYWGIAYGLCLGLLPVPALLTLLSGEELNMDDIGAMLEAKVIPISIASLLFGLAISFGGLFKQISQSDRRMADPSYRAKLRSMGVC